MNNLNLLLILSFITMQNYNCRLQLHFGNGSKRNFLLFIQRKFFFLFCFVLRCPIYHRNECCFNLQDECQYSWRIWRKQRVGCMEWGRVLGIYWGIWSNFGFTSSRTFYKFFLKFICIFPRKIIRKFHFDPRKICFKSLNFLLENMKNAINFKF